MSTRAERPSRMIRVSMALVLCLGCAATSHGAKRATQQLTVCGPVKQGAKAPAFGGWTLGGRVTTLKKQLASGPGEDIRGVVVSFFATWCKPCEAGLPRIQRVSKKLEARGVRTLLVAIEPDAAKAKAFLQRLEVKLPTVIDKFGKVAQKYGSEKTLPRTFVIDRNGQVVAIYGSEGPDFELLLEKALAGSAP